MSASRPTCLRSLSLLGENDWLAAPYRFSFGLQPLQGPPDRAFDRAQGKAELFGDSVVGLVVEEGDVQGCGRTETEAFHHLGDKDGLFFGFELSMRAGRRVQ